MKQPLVIKDICQSGGDNVSEGGGQTGQKSSIPDDLWVRDLDTGERLYPAFAGGDPVTVLTAAAVSVGTALIGSMLAPKPPSPPSFDIPTEAEIQAKESRAERQERLRRQRAMTQQATILTSTLGAPITETQVAKPSLGGVTL